MAGGGALGDLAAGGGSIRALAAGGGALEALGVVAAIVLHVESDNVPGHKSSKFRVCSYVLFFYGSWLSLSLSLAHFSLSRGKAAS